MIPEWSSGRVYDIGWHDQAVSAEDDEACIDSAIGPDARRDQGGEPQTASPPPDEACSDAAVGIDRCERRLGVDGCGRAFGWWRVVAAAGRRPA